jgi:hypothetical protein
MVDGNFGIVVADPLCDEMYAVCDNCPTRPTCTYFASGQVAQCSTIVGTMPEERVQEYAFKVDAQLERQFDQVIRKAGVRVIRDRSPRKSGYRDYPHRSC